MSDDRIDTQIQALMVELIDSTPPAPTWESIQARIVESDPGQATTDTVGGTAEAGDLTDLPEYTRHVERRRPRWRPIAAGAGAVGILVGGTFAYAALVGDKDGADTPEAAVEQFVDSVTAEDAVGVFESLPPSERSLVTDAMSDLSGEAERLGLTQGLDLGHVDGFDFEISDMTMQPETLGEGVVAVHLDGSIVSQSTGAELPLGQSVRDLLTNTSDGNTGLQDFENGVAELQGVFDRDDVFVVAIEEDGGWHVSSWYTIAEYLRRASDQPLPTFGGTVLPPVGASTPHEAVQGFIQAALNNDLQAALQLALPGESRVLYDYGPLFLDEARQNATDMPRQTTINSIDLAESGDGDTRTLSLDGYDYTITDEYGTQHQSFDGDCFTYVYEPTPNNGEPSDEQSCRADALAQDTLPVEWDMSVGADYVVVNRDGRWYLSPVRSVAATVLEGARAIPDAATARQLLDHSGIWLLFPGRFFNLMGGYSSLTVSGSGSGSSCYTEMAADGTETQVCSDSGTTFDENGIPVDENGNPLPEATTATTALTPTTLVATPESVPAESSATADAEP